MLISDLDDRSATAIGSAAARGAASVVAAGASRSRVGAVDLLRGLMVALMVLDHVREYFSASALQFDPTDTLKTSSALFLTRWVTHLCAPTFVLLSGLSVHIQAANGRTGGPLVRRLVARGAWLILLEVTVIGFGFNFAEPFVLLQVIWAIGFGMLALAALLRLPRIALGALGAALVAFNMTLVGLLAPLMPPALFHMLLLPGPLGDVPGMVAYPALPWAGVFLIGYAVGPVLLAPGTDLRRRALACSGILLTAFVAMRLAGLGDLRDWGEGASAALKALSFINVTKYPPSPQYVCLMLGTSALVLAALRDVDPARLPTLRAFGRAPFFTYILHIYVVHGTATLLGAAMGYRPSDFLGFIESTAGLKAAHWGLDLGPVLLVWIATLLLLRPFAVRFAALKDRHSDWWLSYL